MKIRIHDDFDLAAIASSGQCFRWQQTSPDLWRIIHRGECLYISRTGDGEYQADCDEETFERVWRSYFDLDECYSRIRQMADKERDPFLFHAAQVGKGIRILRQDPWEVTVSFIISQNRNIPAIIRSVEQLCQAAGERRIDSRGLLYHTFPGPEAIAEISAEDLAGCRLGYRDKYVSATALAALEGRFTPEEMKDLPDDKLIERLMSLYGVGKKVAGCIALFGFHRLDSFPVDTWIRKALAARYPEGFPYESYRPYGGVFQQYIFACCRNEGLV